MMRQSDKLTRSVIVAFGAFYLILLLAGVAGTSLKYREYYTPPTLDLASGEAEVLRSWNANYEARYNDYKQYVQIVCVGLGLYLAVWTAAIGVWQKSILKGLLALIAGGIVTILALSLLPWVYFPFDRYPVAAVFVIGASPWIALSWILLTIFGRILVQVSLKPS